MNISEKATMLAATNPRSVCMSRASEVAFRIATLPADELVPGNDVCWLIAAAIASKQINGEHAPRVVVRVMDDGVSVSDKLG